MSRRKGMRSFLVIGFAVLGLLGYASWAGAVNLIVNGSFEDGDYSGANYSWERLVNGDTRLTGWTIGGAGVDWHNTTQLNPSYNGVTTEHMIDLNLDGYGSSNTGTISQTFATAGGNVYNVSFYLASPYGDGVQVTVDGASNTYTPSAANPLVWTLESFSFTAGSPSATLQFASTNGDSWWGPILDNVVVQPTAPVPIPGALLLFGPGLAGLAAVRRRFKK